MSHALLAILCSALLFHAALFGKKESALYNEMSDNPQSAFDIQIYDVVYNGALGLILHTHNQGRDKDIRFLHALAGVLLCTLRTRCLSICI